MLCRTCQRFPALACVLATRDLAALSRSQRRQHCSCESRTVAAATAGTGFMLSLARQARDNPGCTAKTRSLTRLCALCSGLGRSSLGVVHWLVRGILSFACACSCVGASFSPGLHQETLILVVRRALFCGAAPSCPPVVAPSRFDSPVAFGCTVCAHQPLGCLLTQHRVCPHKPFINQHMQISLAGLCGRRFVLCTC
jgi:hypothetical protein